MPTIVETARSLAGEGRAVFPCRLTHDGRKLPCTPNGLHAASTDPDTVARLFHHYPGTLVGVACGPISGIAALDIDAKWQSARDWFAQNRLQFPVTRVHRTRSGGLHLLFLYRSEFPTTVGRIIRGVDTRSVGGYVVWWPAAGCPVLHEGPIAAAPQFLTEALKPYKPKYQPPSGMIVPDRRRVRKILDRLEQAAEGERNQLLFWAACRFAEMRLTDACANGQLLQTAQELGLPYREANATIMSALRGR
jgi:hypothetical protein